MMADPFDDPAVREWVNHVKTDMVPKLADSEFSISLVPGGDTDGDVKFWVELGASIMMDKPIIAVVFDGREVPEKLRLVADEIVEIPEGVSPEGSEQLAEALDRVAARLGIGSSDDSSGE